MGLLYGQGNYGEGTYGFAPTPLVGELFVEFELEGGIRNPVWRVSGDVEFEMNLEGAMDKHRPFSGATDTDFVTAGVLSVDAAMGGKVTISVELVSKEYLGPLWEIEKPGTGEWGITVIPDGMWVPIKTKPAPWA